MFWWYLPHPPHRILPRRSHSRPRFQQKHMCFVILCKDVFFLNCLVRNSEFSGRQRVKGYRFFRRIALSCGRLILFVVPVPSWNVRQISSFRSWESRVSLATAGRWIGRLSRPSAGGRLKAVASLKGCHSVGAIAS